MGKEQGEERKLTGKVTAYFKGSSELGSGFLVAFDSEDDAENAIKLGAAVELTVRAKA